MHLNAKWQATSSNFNFLAKHYPQLEKIGALAERYFSDDPIVSLITVRQFGEALAQLAAARSGLFTDSNEPQADLLRRASGIRDLASSRSISRSMGRLSLRRQ
jgi:hypothetical protein